MSNVIDGINYFDFKATDMDSGKLLLAKTMETVGAKLETPTWIKRFSDEWEFNKLIVGKVVIPVGISTGGVVSFEGDPFPSGIGNSTSHLRPSFSQSVNR